MGAQPVASTPCAVVGTSIQGSACVSGGLLDSYACIKHCGPLWYNNGYAVRAYTYNTSQASQAAADIVYTCHHACLAACRELGVDILIDDNPVYAVECAEAGINVLLYDWQLTYPWSKTTDG